MLRIRFKYIAGNKRTKLILVLALCISLCIGTVGLYSYSQYRRALDTELNTPNVELLQINLDVSNRAFREADGRAVDVSFHEAALGFISSQSSDRESRSASLQAYLQTMAEKPDIHSIEVLALEGRSRVSSLGGYPSGWSGGAPLEGWMAELNDKPLLVKRRSAGGVQGAGTTELLSLVRPVRQNGQVTGAVIVNLDYDRLFSKLYTSSANYLYVYNLDGELIYPKLNLPIPLSGMEEVTGGLDVRPFAYVRAEGQEYMANQTFSDVTGWRLISLVPVEKLLKNAKLARDMMLLLSLLSIAVGCAAVYSYNYAAFRPLKRIQRLLRPLQRDAAAQGDLYDLEPVIGKLVEEWHRESLVARQSLPELRSKFLEDLLARSLGAREAQAKWEQYFQDWKPGDLTVFVVSIDRYGEWASRFPEEDRRLLKYALNNILLEALEPAWRAVSMGDPPDGAALLLQPKDPDRAAPEREALSREAARIREMLSQYLSLSVSAGIGPAVPSVTQAARSLAEAREALSYRLYAGYGSIHARPSAVLPAEKDEPSGRGDAGTAEWLSALAAGGSEACAEWARSWTEAFRTGGVRPSSVYREVDALMEELLRTATALGAVPPAELADYTPGQGATLELGDVAALLERCLTAMARELVSRRQRREYQIVQAMKDYMEDHLDGNIGLQEIADSVQMSISSVSSMFKEETGSTIYDYLTHLRIGRACRLLEETPMKIAEIAQRVGYQNENSFIRAFRKVKTVTPGRYREGIKSSGGYADRPNPRSSGISEDLP
ncbi:helix-turn-helix domain-containing protein [Paenibacillus caseinilyticus]|uniref:AraC family transcriptional regulator n=1 Tax=Paenibacillus mucilaginosus K02 TaxID=997761 RepID=I0BGF9_9BACL|nr:helix-turn-helix domain-containing protein [Paenibacillus mucilaginosus]AFH61456.1 AraC family transcriptional regulator [Paenibacillus mucilaginosus K02]